MRLTSVFGAMIAVALAGCAHTHPVVMYAPSGNLMVNMTGRDRPSASARAKRAAYHHCTEQQQLPVWVKEETRYQGVLPDEEYRIIAIAGQGIARAYGSPDAAHADAGLTAPNDYVTTLEFQCR